MKNFISSVFIFLLSIIGLRAYAADWVVLMKNPNANDLAVLDAIGYSFLTPEQLQGEWKKQRPPGPQVDLTLTLATAEQLRKGMTAEMITTHRINPGVWGGPECKNIRGCVGLSFDQSVVESADLMAHIEAVVQQPCKYVPANDRDHWPAFSYPAYITRKFLNCDESKKLPYDEVRIYAFATNSDTGNKANRQLIKTIKIHNDTGHSND